ncbi:uncharacterized protein TNIN_395141 [Trichonephila inaurata madagascariensis]|uniref:Uncharacterized protein n=1 Tax=Trichonephila inaurata madagascariensis TaxID=2747483 RepID=A0A8X6YQ96_9ARAC|nr:uncharacterized protein TNIN_395141 [Trichonephila inaurata madagascariensis]
MQKKTLRDVIRYLKLEFKLFFHQKKKKGKRCILDEPDEAFDTETHELLCQSGHKSLIQVLQEFCHLMPDNHIRNNIVGGWVARLGSTVEPVNEEMML